MADRGRGFAFVLEGETEKEFYMAFLQYLCKKHSTEMIRIAYESVPDIVYQIDTETGAVLIKFHVVCSITQMPQASNWIKAQCIHKYRAYTWDVFLCYDKDDYRPRISKFYEGDWKNLRNALQGLCAVTDVAATADIEDILLIDKKGVCTYLGCEVPEEELRGGKGKTKMKNLFRSNGKTYHEGERARPLIDSLDMASIIESNTLPLREIEEKIFE